VLTAGDRVLRLAPALIATEGDCDRALEILERALARVVS
jgi:acetylornithine/succinyldiaminopimelate/putrescine aminotransferase